jgi:hypothetical protein
MGLAIDLSTNLKEIARNSERHSMVAVAQANKKHSGSGLRFVSLLDNKTSH